FNQLIMCDNTHFCKTQLYSYNESNHYYMDVNETQACYVKRKLSESDDQEDDVSSEESEDDLDENEEDSDEDNQQHSHTHNHQDNSDLYHSSSCYQSYSASLSKFNSLNRCSTITTRRHSDTVVTTSKTVSSTTTPILKRRCTYSTMHDDEQKRTILLESYRKLRGIKKPKLHVSLMICNLIKRLEKTFKTPSPSSTTITSTSHSCNNTNLVATTTTPLTNIYPMRTPPQHYGLTSTHDHQYSPQHHHSRTSFRTTSSDSISPQLLDFNDIMYNSSTNSSTSLINDSVNDIADNNNCPYNNETKTHLNDYINETYTPFHHHYTYSPPLISSTQYCAVSSSPSSLSPQLQQSITTAPSIITSSPNAKDILLSTYYDTVSPILVTENTNSNCELTDNTGVSSTSCTTSHYNTDTFWTTLDSLQQSNFAIPASIVSEDELIAPHGGGEYIDISGNTLSAYTFCHSPQTNNDSLPNTNSSSQTTISTTINSSDCCCNETTRTILDDDSSCAFTTNNTLQSSDLCTILLPSNTNELDMNNNETFSSLVNTSNLTNPELSSSSSFSCITITDCDNTNSLIANNNISFYPQVTTTSCSYSPSSSSSDHSSSQTYYHAILNYNLHESSRTNNGIITTA
ncbi:unnamed protein product, partial [Didymodactylos carnosus]